MIYKQFESLQLPHEPPTQARRRYSVTADILAYQQCSLQYGAFSARKYEPALVVQLFYGTIIHQVLDRAHAHYRGDLGAPAGSLPTDADIDAYFAEVENALIARRIRAVQSVRDQAKTILKRFNTLEGSTLYPRIIDTECRLQADQGQYILHGNVDVLVATDDTADVEIWDYKGAYKPSQGDADYQRYVFQMQVYADLYRQRTGTAPRKAVLYFLNELSGDTAPSTRPVNALLEVSLDPQEVQQALQSFGGTVGDIEQCRDSRVWPNPVEAPPEKTCSACDLRWNCPAVGGFNRTYPLIYP
ncbi:PD-(D/E)XK nuclease family protein [Rhodopirellula baltica]